MDSMLVSELEAEQEVAGLITEDDEPVDNLFADIQQRLLVSILYASLAGLLAPGRKFSAHANVGLFRSVTTPPIVPDVFLSLDVELSFNERRHPKAYFIWQVGKAPDVVVELVSNRVGEELGTKLADYAQIGIPYYIVYDPDQYLKAGLLRVYELQGQRYTLRTNRLLPSVGLGVTLWDGVAERKSDTWLRWTDLSGDLLPTAEERAAQVAAERDQQRQRAERLAARLRALGMNGDL